MFYQQSDTDGFDGDQDAYGASVRFPSSQGVRGILQYKRYGEQFNPALGFLDSAGVSDTFFNVGYMLRPSEGNLESWLAGLDYQRIDYLNGGGLKTEAFFLRPLTLTNRTNDTMTLAISDFTERLVEPFQIYPGVIVPVGIYDSDSRGIPGRNGRPPQARGFYAHRRVPRRQVLRRQTLRSVSRAHVAAVGVFPRQLELRVQRGRAAGAERLRSRCGSCARVSTSPFRRRYPGSI